MKNAECRHSCGSDSELVNICGSPSFPTGKQSVTKIEIYLDVLPGEFDKDDTIYLFHPTQVLKRDRVSGEIEISVIGLALARYVVYAVATDSEGYTGPIYEDYSLRLIMFYCQ